MGHYTPKFVLFQIWRNRIGFWLHGWCVYDIVRNGDNLPYWVWIFFLLLNAFFPPYIVYKTRGRLRRMLQFIFWLPTKQEYLLVNKLIRRTFWTSPR